MQDRLVIHWVLSFLDASKLSVDDWGGLYGSQLNPQNKRRDQISEFYTKLHLIRSRLSCCPYIGPPSGLRQNDKKPQAHVGSFKRITARASPRFRFHLRSNHIILEISRQRYAICES